MNKNWISFALIALLMLSLVACAANQPISRGGKGAGIGAAGGAILGQAIGRSTEATLIGGAIGSLLGYIVGNEMDKTDRQQLNYAYETAPAGQPVSWVNPDSGNNYQVIPQAAYANPQTNQPCRKAEIIATIDGKAQKTYTTACRNSQGEWVLQN